MERIPMITDAEHAWAGKKLRNEIAKSGTSDEALDTLGQLYYDKIVDRRSTSAAGRLKSLIRIPSLPALELPKARQVAKAAGFAIATGVIGYFTGNGWIERYNEFPQAQETLFTSGPMLRRFGQAYASTDDPSLRAMILQEVYSIAPDFNQARKIDNKWDDLDGLLLAGSAATLLAGMGTLGSLPIRRSRGV